MSKKEIYKNELKGLFNKKDFKGIEKYLLDNSNLPSPQSNLGLANVFATFFDKNIGEDFILILYNWLKINENKLENDSKDLYLIFCSLQALGHVLIWIENKKVVLKIFEEKMNSKLWRIRESCVIGLQDYGEKKPEKLNDYLNSLYFEATVYQKRAVFAILAHPPILKYDYIVDTSFLLTKEVFDEILNLDSKILKEDEWKTLLKSLEYVVSVFIAFSSEDGFDILNQYAGKDNKVIKKIIKVNLEKNRLKKWPDKVEKIKYLL